MLYIFKYQLVTNKSANTNYAGCFVGKVKVAGDLKVSGNIDGTLLGQSSSTILTSEQDETVGVLNSSYITSPFAKKMATLSTTSYYHSPQLKIEKMKTASHTVPNSPVLLSDSLLSPIDEEEQPNIIEEQILSKKHYALNADELELAFPDLVYVKEDGSKAINYVEMVPLLVQTINELNARISVLEKNSNNVMSMAPATSSYGTLGIAAKATTSAVLEQNTPNPFSERTTIGFTLPADAFNAYIYIFDMQGKMLKQLPIAPTMQSVAINNYELQAGIYIYSLFVNGQEIDTKRMILSK